MRGMTRRIFIVGGGSLVLATVSARAAAASGPRRIGFLGDGIAAAREADTLMPFRQGLRELGYVEGRDVIVDARWTEGRAERLAGLAADFVRDKVDVIVTHGVPGSLAAKAATTTIPIVVAVTADIVGDGIVASLARPGGNITRADALIVVHAPTVTTHRLRIAAAALHRRLPAISAPAVFADAGGLMSYGPVIEAYFRRAATFVDKILKGARPADIPVEQGTRFELVINLKTARALGITVPPAMLLRANRVIE